MLDVLQFIFSSFWVWIGFTILLLILSYFIVTLLGYSLKFKEASAAVIRKEVVKSAFNEIQKDSKISSYNKILMAEALIRMSKNAKKLSDSEIMSIIGNVLEKK